MSRKTRLPPLKTSTYASLVTIVFFLHRDARSKSIASVIRSTDQLCELFGYSNNVSRMTKYRIIAELINQGILRAYPTAKNKKIFLSQKIVKLITQNTE